MVLRLFFIRHELQKIPRLAIQFPAEGGESFKAHRAGLARLENAQIRFRDTDAKGKLIEPHPAFRHDYIQIHSNTHSLSDRKVRLLLQKICLLQDIGEEPEEKSSSHGSQIIGAEAY